MSAYAQASCEDYLATAYLFMGGRDYLLYYGSPAFDSNLHQSVTSILKRFPDKSDPVNIGRALTSEILETWYYGGAEQNSAWKNFLHQFDEGKYELFLGGEFIKRRMGLCRHRASTLTYALREMGFNVRYVTGRTIWVMKDGRRTSSGAHAWVELDHHGETYLFDPMNRDIPLGFSLHQRLIDQAGEQNILKVQLKNDDAYAYVEFYWRSVDHLPFQSSFRQITSSQLGRLIPKIGRSFRSFELQCLLEDP